MDQPELDHVGRIVAQWTRERPDLDVTPQGVIGRLHRLAARLTDELVTVYGRFGLGEGEFDVLATLRRSGAPYELTPGELATQTMVSSGAVTKRVDRCVEQGWVTRRVSDSDARGRMVALTPAGVALIDEAFGAHMANEHRLVAMLDGAERTRLAQLLEKWGRALDA
ncbi:MarR family transcriptional regulator [Nocardioides sp. LMS-CY]|uniref:DNA-binding MarR family transcriptional regulator n=1 Tax=Nocardioides soli TaxID=1036020 RepID=A0A7W4W0V6_9ACTN|nr:MarR family transcriptional regulator [Nocardioides sp. LMS-CY]MBB3045240.1 DNA-binding MarR family transcriptional regulator [Nocardioides soli]QWF21863.1 MarR family transcriptional regulator [Nocardioides sp. LMS-CY]